MIHALIIGLSLAPLLLALTCWLKARRAILAANEMEIKAGRASLRSKLGFLRKSLVVAAILSATCIALSIHSSGSEGAFFWLIVAGQFISLIAMGGAERVITFYSYKRVLYFNRLPDVAD